MHLGHPCDWSLLSSTVKCVSVVCYPQHVFWYTCLHCSRKAQECHTLLIESCLHTSHVCDGENLLYLVSVLRVMILPFHCMSGDQSPQKGSWTFKDNLLRTAWTWQVHTSSLYMHSNEWWLLNNNSLILLKLRGTHPVEEYLPTQTLCWSLDNALRSLPYCGLEGTLQKHGLSPLLLPTNIPLASYPVTDAGSSKE